VFVDGCFWHACPEHGSKPRANEWYWGPKLIKNVERDRVNDAALILAGWTVVRLWEHVPIDEAVGTVVTALTETIAPGPANAAGQANTAGPANAAGPSSPADAAEPPNRIPPATDDSLG
jgi:G:T-mismatch repair DNA endonuclease (very short patch repair protein)